MGHEMKISATTVRRLRSERGWPQEQLATAAGLSLRTIQRVEADGSASLATVASLAATFGMRVADFADVSTDQPRSPDSRRRQLGTLVAGMAILMCAWLSESGRLPGTPMSDAFTVINGLLGGVGILLAALAGVGLASNRQYAAIMLAILGTPLVALALAGLLVAVTTGHAPMWQLCAFGLGGVALMTIAWRQLTTPRSVAT